MTVLSGAAPREPARVHPAFIQERKNTFLEMRMKRADLARSRSRSAPPFDRRTASRTVDWSANSSTEKGRPGRYVRSWMDAVVPPDSVAVYQTYLATAPSKPSGITLMWHGVSREWEDAQFLEMIDGFALDGVEFAYLPLNFWLRNQDAAKKPKKGTAWRLKNKGYGFVHLSNTEKEAEFSHKVAMLSMQLGRVMYTTRATTQGVTNQLMQTIHVSKARSAFRGMVHVRIKDELKSVSRFSLWQLHQKAIHRGTARECEPQGEELGDETD
jgi:hypothetical protein